METLSYAPIKALSLQTDSMKPATGNGRDQDVEVERRANQADYSLFDLLQRWTVLGQRIYRNLALGILTSGQGFVIFATGMLKIDQMYPNLAQRPWE